MRLIVVFLLLAFSIPAQAQSPYDSISAKIVKKGLGDLKAYSLLSELVTQIGPRLSGSANAEKAVQWGKSTMESLGFENVHLEKIMVPHWVRGSVEELTLEKSPMAVSGQFRICALGGSIGTPKDGITAEVVEVKSWDELKALGTKVKNKIVFFNRPFDRSLFSSGAQYVGAVDQRGKGAIEAARYGALAAIVRSMTQRIDEYPHTGAMNYNDSIPKIPAAAIATIDAERLSGYLAQGKSVTLKLKLDCQMLPDVESANVVGELRGSEKPEEVIVMGGHLDSWDKGRGAHDDGAGVVHSLDALHILKDLGLRPKRTIRVVLFMNEENGVRGGKAYADSNRAGEKPVAAIESDGGGDTPRGFSVESDSAAIVSRVQSWSSLLTPIEADRITKGHSGTDVGPLAKKGTVCIGLHTDGQRYFDYHHSDHDTLDKVHDRELELGAVAMAILSYVIGMEGI